MSNCEVHQKLPYRNYYTKYFSEKSLKTSSFPSKPYVTSTLKYDPPIHPLPSPTFLSFKTFPCSSITMSNNNNTPWSLTAQCAVLSQQLKHVHRLLTLRVFHAKLLCAQIACLFHGHRPSLHHDLPQSPQIYSGDAQLWLAVSVSFSSA